MCLCPPLLNGAVNETINNILTKNNFWDLCIRIKVMLPHGHTQIAEARKRIDEYSTVLFILREFSLKFAYFGT